jgi:threonine dehydrogenase-like Zn-dependent dehydrogenase
VAQNGVNNKNVGVTMNIVPTAKGTENGVPMPFIIRGVTLTGIDSPMCPYKIREAIWPKLAGEWKPANLEMIRNRVIGLDDLPSVFDAMLAAQSLGRVVVKL